MSNDQRIDFRRRWSPDSSAKALNYLRLGNRPPFDTLEDGRADLRGFCISEILRHVSIDHVDLSESFAERFGQFIGCIITDSRFRFTRYATNLSSRFHRCDFSHSDLSGSHLIGDFDCVEFSESKMKSIIANQVRFRKCRFFKTNLRKAELYNCTFEDCTFEDCSFGSGSIGGSKFVRTHLALKDLSKTVVDGVTFTDF